MNTKNIEFIKKQLKHNLSKDDMEHFHEKLTFLDDADFYQVETIISQTKKYSSALLYSLFLADSLYLKPVSEIKEWMILCYLALILFFPLVLIPSVIILIVKSRGLKFKVMDYNSKILQAQIL